MREKMIGLIDEYTENLSARDLHKADFNEKFADYLLQNGVVIIQRGEWIQKEHWVPLARDYEVSSVDWEDYDEKTHSMKKEYWHCSCCDYEASAELDEWLDKNNIPKGSDYTTSGCMIYAEPYAAAELVRHDILNFEEDAE